MILNERSVDYAFYYTLNACICIVFITQSFIVHCVRDIYHTNKYVLIFHTSWKKSVKNYIDAHFAVLKVYLLTFP